MGNLEKELKKATDAKDFVNCVTIQKKIEVIMQRNQVSSTTTIIGNEEV